ncbi:MAG: peptide deformylase [Bacilli bacterium]|nr:peptide deformylase [Bacilli bacterium]
MLKIFKDSDKVLRVKATPVAIPLSIEDETLALAMFQHIKESQDPELSKKYGLRAGVGLAAPQVGVSKQIIIIHIPQGDKTNYTYVLANPVITSSSVRRTYLRGGEACLSVDENHPGPVYRYHKIKVSAYDILSKSQIEINAFGYEAIVLQHEIDHLNGILFYDRIDPENRRKYPDAIVI